MKPVIAGHRCTKKEAHRLAQQCQVDDPEWYYTAEEMGSGEWMVSVRDEEYIFLGWL